VNRTDDIIIVGFVAWVVFVAITIGYTWNMEQKEMDWCEQQGGYVVEANGEAQCFELKRIEREQQ